MGLYLKSLDLLESPIKIYSFSIRLCLDEDRVKDPVEDRAMGRVKDLAKDLVADLAEDPVKDRAEDLAKDLAEDLVEDLAEDPVEDLAEDLAEDQAKALVQDQSPMDNLLHLDRDGRRRISCSRREQPQNIKSSIQQVSKRIHFRDPMIYPNILVHLLLLHSGRREINWRNQDFVLVVIRKS